MLNFVEESLMSLSPVEIRGYAKIIQVADIDDAWDVQPGSKVQFSLKYWLIVLARVSEPRNCSEAYNLGVWRLVINAEIIVHMSIINTLEYEIVKTSKDIRELLEMLLKVVDT